jgi:hypothetical protein
MILVRVIFSVLKSSIRLSEVPKSGRIFRMQKLTQRIMHSIVNDGVMIIDMEAILTSKHTNSQITILVTY